MNQPNFGFLFISSIQACVDHDFGTDGSILPDDHPRCFLRADNCWSIFISWLKRFAQAPREKYWALIEFVLKFQKKMIDGYWPKSA